MSAIECPFRPYEKFPEFFRRGNFISFENVKFPKFFGVFVDFAQFYYLNQIQLAQYQIQLTQEDVPFTLVQISMF